MNDKKIDEMINKLGPNFTSLGANDPEKVKSIESQLSVVLPEDYRQFLLKYGDVEIPGSWILGTYVDEIAHCVSYTLDFRKYGLPTHYIVIQDYEGDEQYCLDTSQIKDGKCPVVIWTQMWGLEDRSYNSFTEYFISQLEYAIKLCEEDY